MYTQIMIGIISISIGIIIVTIIMIIMNVLTASYIRESTLYVNPILS